jgi:hypothetical protein
MSSKQGLKRYKGAGTRPSGMTAAVSTNRQRGQLVKRKDGSIVEVRPGYRPRVLTGQEVAALNVEGGE